MRKSASEIIRDLELRVAQLEKEASKGCRVEIQFHNFQNNPKAKGEGKDCETAIKNAIKAVEVNGLNLAKNRPIENVTHIGHLNGREEMIVKFKNTPENRKSFGSLSLKIFVKILSVSIKDIKF